MRTLHSFVRKSGAGFHQPSKDTLLRPRSYALPAIALVLASMLYPAVLRAQFGEPRNKLPVVNKITSNGPTRQAFTGSVQALDNEHHVLDVISEGGSNTAIFPLRKKMKISTASGEKLKLAALTPGTSIVVYYEQKGGHRAVDQIVVLATASKKKSHASL